MTINNYKEVFESLAPIRDEFCLRYYRWALGDIRREVDENLRLLRRIKGSIAYRFIEFAERLGNDERLLLLRGCVKRGHPRAVELMADQPTLEERALLENYLSSSRGSGGATENLKITKKGFRKILMSKLAHEGLGEFDPWDPPNEWRYRSRVCHWTVETYVDLGGPWRQLGYRHIIKAQHDVPLLLEWISCMAWMGIATSDWDMLTNEDLPEAADDLAVLCRHFLDAVPQLLNGLDPP